jgi:hypothetical protein
VRIRCVSNRIAICRQNKVGTAGFEPATFRPPAGCATKLRHVPTRDQYSALPNYEPPMRNSGRGGTVVRAAGSWLGLTAQSDSGRS